MKGKRTSWLQMPAQLRVDPKLGDAIRIIAAANFRSCGNQILLWIYEGIKLEEVRNCGEKLGPQQVDAKRKHNLKIL